MRWGVCTLRSAGMGCVCVSLAAFDERQEASRKGKRKLKAQQQAGGSGGEGGAASAESVSERAQVKLPAKAEAKEDPTLEAALFFIEGTRGTLGKRADAKRRREEVRLSLSPLLSSSSLQRFPQKRLAVQFFFVLCACMGVRSAAAPETQSR